VALVLNGAFLVAELVGGLAFGSLALLADAAHMASDVVGLVIAMVAATLATRPASARHTFGLQRAEVLGAQANAVALLAATAWVVVAAFQRLQHPSSIEVGPVLVVAVLGLAANVVSAVVLARAAGQSLNMRGAVIHMTADAAGSVAVIVAAVGVHLFAAEWLDPVASLVISLLVVWSAWGLLRATTRVLLESTPEGLDPAAVRRAIEEDPHVEAVHHLHLWSIASDAPALSAHLVLRDVDDLHAAQAVSAPLKALLLERFDIAHATLELECHPCDDSGNEAGCT
jgi:cobalt-zinc-cadmium efflux system protein